ncbi:unnamed protein product [Symbiodinium sp. CCMP2592]|nr:unnamed protein product [Symbiodinium sp. CCMP2592]
MQRPFCGRNRGRGRRAHGAFERQTAWRRARDAARRPASLSAGHGGRRGTSKAEPKKVEERAKELKSPRLAAGLRAGLVSFFIGDEAPATARAWPARSCQGRRFLGMAVAVDSGHLKK